MFKKIFIAIAFMSATTLSIANEFHKITLKKFVAAGSDVGIVLNAPESWKDNGDDGLFQVIDSSNNAQFTSSAYAVDKTISLEYFSNARFGIVNSNMPYLKQVKSPYSLNGKSWVGIATEYQGKFPGNNLESHYLVLCIISNGVAISFTITAPVDEFAKNEKLYRWLLTNHLEINKVVRANG